MKRTGRDRSKLLGAKFNWMREDLLAVVGGNFYVNTPIAVRIENVPIVWFNRDDEGRLLVNLQAPTTSGKARMIMEDNFWITEGSDERDIVCPPSGKLVSASYPNGDRLKVEFREIASLEDFERRYEAKMPGEPTMDAETVALLESVGMPLPESYRPDAAEEDGPQFPLAAVEISLKIAGTDIDLGGRGTKVGGSSLTGGWIIGGEVGLQIELAGPG
jgi:hypothetical protein